MKSKISTLSFLIILVTGALRAQVITTLQPVVTFDSLNPVCAGSVIQVPFWSTGVYNPFNIYIAELSDSAGNFTGYPGDTIGYLASSFAYPSIASPPVQGIVAGLIPFNIPAGCHYYIRVVSDSPHVYGAAFGPFCIQHCDIYTDSSNSIQVCIKSCYKTPGGFTKTIPYTINKYDANEHYYTGNKFEVQILNSQTFAVVNTGGLGVKVDTVSGKITVHVPCGDSLCNILGITSGIYYMRVIATKSNQADSMLGTVTFLTIGYPQDSLVIDPAAATSTYCVNNTATFYAYPFNACTNNWTNSTYSWYDNSFEFPGVTSFSINILFNATGSLNLIVYENNNGCSGPLDTLKVKVNGPPIVNITGPIRLCLGDTGVYTVPFTNNNYYKWTAQYSKIVDTAANVIKVKYDSAGRFKITIYAADSCGVDSSYKYVTVSVCTGVSDLSFNDELKVMPNPTSGNINLYSEMTLSNASIEIYDIMGRQVMSSTMESLSAGESCAVNISSLSTGVYYMRVLSEEGTRIFKVMKE